VETESFSVIDPKLKKDLKEETFILGVPRNHLIDMEDDVIYRQTFQDAVVPGNREAVKR